VAYACLAEAAVLAMEGRFENFTLGRNIEMDKVKEMYRLFKKHGLALEGLRSFGRYVSDEELARKRSLADDLRQHPERLEALVAQGVRPQPPPHVGAGGRSISLRRGAWAAAGAGILAAITGLLLWRQRRDGNRTGDPDA
jgi:hypothetical protein